MASVVALSACGGNGGSSKVPANAVAVVDGTPIARDEFDALWKSTVGGYEAQGRKVPEEGTPEHSVLQNQLLEILVQRIVAEKKAQEDFGITVTDAQVERRLQQFIQQAFGGSKERYRKQIAAQGQTDEQVRASVKAQMLSARISEELAKKVEVTDAEIGTYYRAHRNRYRGRSLAQARTEIRSTLLQEKRNRAFADWALGARREFRSKIRYAKGFSAPPSVNAGSTQASS